MSQLHPNLDLDQANKDLQGKSPEQIVEWALTQAKNPIITNEATRRGGSLNVVTCRCTASTKYTWSTRWDSWSR